MARPELRFVYRWANHIGRTPRELLASVNSEEVAYMMAFERLEPFGSLHAEMIGGVIASVVANVNRDPKTTPTPFSPDDFFPALRKALGDKPEERKVIGADMTPDQLSALIDAQFFGRTLH